MSKKMICQTCHGNGYIRHPESREVVSCSVCACAGEVARPEKTYSARRNLLAGGRITRAISRRHNEALYKNSKLKNDIKKD
jgi:hypothetical protein